MMDGAVLLRGAWDHFSAGFRRLSVMWAVLDSLFAEGDARSGVMTNDWSTSG